MYKIGDEVSVKGEITKACESGVVVKAHYFGEAYFDSNNMDLIGKTYEEGLADAWELAKKLESMPLEELKKVFGVCGFHSVVKQYKIEEALAKIEAYEKEKEIKVGDVVRVGNNYGVVTWLKDGWVSVLWDDGSTHDDCKSKDLTKTGKHIDIESLLRQIGE